MNKRLAENTKALLKQAIEQNIVTDDTLTRITYLIGNDLEKRTKEAI